MTTKIYVGYFFRIFVTTSLPPSPSTLRLCPPPFTTLTCVTTNSESNYISSFHVTHFQTRPCVSKWKLHVSVEKCQTASQHATSHRYSNYVFSFPTKCTGTTEYLYYIVNVCYMFRHSLCHPLITSQNHLLVVSLCYNGLVTEREVDITKRKYCLSN
jgi:hypothetical protein